MKIESNTSDCDYLTVQYVLQKDENIKVEDEHVYAEITERVGASRPRCLTRIRRLAALVAVLLILAIGLIVLIYMLPVVEHKAENECNTKPCVHGICKDGIGKYECDCFAGYNGTNCEKEGTSYNDFWIGPVSIESKILYVNFTLVRGQDTYSSLLACAEASIDNRFLATRVDNGTGECEALTWDWGSDPQYETGFSYLRKTKTVESYFQPLQINKTFQWLFPGTFGNGSILDFYMTIPPGQQWKEFELMVIDTTDYNFQVYDSVTDIILIYVQIQHWGDFASAHFKVYKAGWTNTLYLGRTSLADGKPHRFTFVPLTGIMKILIDEIQVVEYTHITDPATAKQIKFIPYNIPEIQIHNITFIGVLNPGA